MLSKEVISFIRKYNYFTAKARRIYEYPAEERESLLEELFEKIDIENARMVRLNYKIAYKFLPYGGVSLYLYFPNNENLDEEVDKILGELEDE